MSFPEPTQWNGDEPPDRFKGTPHTYICLEPRCGWQGKAAKAAEHHHEHPRHPIRGKDWPANWPNCQWTVTEREHAHKRTA